MPDSLLHRYRVVLITFIITLGLFTTYNLNFRHGTSVDSIPSTLLPVSILKEGNLDLDEFRTVLSTNTKALQAGLALGTLQVRDGRLLSSYPIGGALLSTPFFALALVTGQLENWHDFRVTAKLSASLFVAVSAAFLFLTLTSFLSLGNSIFLTLLYGLGTTSWSIASQDLWQHGPGLFCLSIAVFALSRMNENESVKTAMIAGIFIGLAVLCRYLNVIPALALSLYILFYHRRQLLPYAFPLASIGLWLVIYNQYTYGTITGGYSAIYTSPWHAWRGLTPATTYSNPFLYGLLSVLVSPSKGLLIYSPHLIFGFFAIFVLLYKGKNPLVPFLTIWLILITVVLSKNTLWWGGTAYGPRYFSEAVYALTLLTALNWTRIVTRPWILSIFSVLAVVSLIIQFVGAFYSPCGWADSPTLADIHPERHWDWNDTEILRCINKGIRDGHVPFEILEYSPGDTEY